jgi:polyhydroxyalkanoate synthesis repressor PhaR
MSDHPKPNNLIEIKKYQNRRFYDSTNSRHLSLEKIHQLICDGFEIKVTDVKSGKDITTKILAQILLEYEPTKLDFFSPTVLAQVIRLNDKVLKDFHDTYYNKALQVFLSSKDQFEILLRQSQSLPFANPMQSMVKGENPFEGWMKMNPFTPGVPPGEDSKTGMGSDLEELKKQVSELKDILKKKTK